VISASRGLVDVVWAREIEGGNFATPERRAALEKRIGELSNAIRDEVVRRYYRQDFAERLSRMFAPEAARSSYGGGRASGNYGESGRRFAPRGGQNQGRFAPRSSGRPQGPGAALRGPYQPASSQLAASSIMRGQRSALSRREALILQCLLNHPWLLHDHLEEAAALELPHPEAHKLRAGIIAAFGNYLHTDDSAAEVARVISSLEKSGYIKQIQMVGQAITTSAVWGIKAGAAREDVLSTWRQLVALHQKTNALLREKKDAELALGEDPSDQNLAWLKDVGARLESLDGTEAQIEGFGELSGRIQGSV
jgi:DNA primase